jgi:Uncharacterized conserved protein
MHRLFFSFLILFFSLLSYGQTINTESSKVDFSVSNFKINTVKGSFTGMEGEVIFSPDDLSAAKLAVCIDAASVNTGNKKRDDHLKTEDFFGVETYPEICFESTSIIKTDKGYLALGNLMMHGVSKNIEIPFVYDDNKFVGDFKVKRLDYKVGKGTGGFSVGKEITIQIVCVLI